MILLACPMSLGELLGPLLLLGGGLAVLALMAVGAVLVVILCLTRMR
ncbi:MAG TPA: hypothetical protein VFF73_18625 [Planctomycetota bacterium]|nr:hypothetical protein [Planctomycetota bacterium]